MNQSFCRYLLFSCVALLSTLSVSAQSTSLPFELFGDHIFIKLKVNNSRDLDFIFDSADALTVLNEGVAKEIGLPLDHKAVKLSAGGSTSGALVKHQKVEINNLEIKNIEVYATDLNHLEISIGRKIDGIIGFDILDNYSVTIDYDKMEFRVADPASFTYSGKGTAFDVKLNTYVPHVSGKVVTAGGETLTGEFFIDTGAKAAVDFNSPFVQSSKLVSKLPSSYNYMVAGLSKDETLHHRGRVAEFKFGEFSFKQLPVGLSEAKTGLQSNSKIAGIIGNEILMQFNITYDYARKKIYLEPNASYGKQIADDGAGFDLHYSKDLTRLLVHRVHENSPAMAGGIKVDDELVSIDGQDVSTMTLPQIRKKLSGSGNTVQLKFKSAGQEKNGTLTLKEII